MARKKKSKLPELDPKLTTPIELGEYSKTAMLRYGSYVLTDRAVPDIRDGLKPVQRRIAWAMHGLKLHKTFKKSAKIVGETMGNYHPHGDMSLYSAMVNMTFDRYPLVEGRGNFGGPDDNPAASRYTEARLTPFAQELLREIHVADMVPNYSGDMEEPLVFPARAPLALLNGSQGIGVGLRTNIPPHNLGELVKALAYYLKKDKPRLDTAMKYLQGPDYGPGQGILLSSQEEIRSLYENGAGRLDYRCVYSIEPDKKNKQIQVLVVSSLCPGFTISSFMKKMIKLREDGLIEYARNLSKAEGIRIAVGFKDPLVINERVIPELYSSQSYQFYVTKRNEESLLDETTLFSGGLFRLFDEFLHFRSMVEKRRLKSEWAEAKKRLVKAQAILKAIDSLDKVYKVLKEKHTSLAEMRSRLAEELDLSEEAAQFVLDMKVHRLARMNADEQQSEIDGINDQMRKIKADAADIKGVILRHLKALLEYDDERGMVADYLTPTKPPSLKVGSAPTKYVLRQGTKITRFDEAPSRRRSNIDDLVYDTASVTVVCRDNSAEQLQLSYFSEHAASQDVVGLIPGGCDIVVALDKRSYVVALDHSIKKTKFDVMRDAVELVSAVGVKSDGWLAILNEEKGKGWLLRASDLSVRKTTFSRGTGKYKGATKLIRLSEGEELYEQGSGRCITCSEPGTFTFKDKVVALGLRNHVIDTSGKAHHLSGDEALALLVKAELAHSWTLPSQED